MIKVSNKITKDCHDLCGKSIYSNYEEHYKYDICNWAGFTRYYFDNVLLKTKSDEIVILISKDLDNKTFAASYNCIYGVQKVKLFRESIKEIINIE